MKCSFPEHQEVDEPTRKAPNLVAFKRNDCSKFRPTYLLAVSSSCKFSTFACCIFRAWSERYPTCSRYVWELQRQRWSPQESEWTIPEQNRWESGLNDILKSKNIYAIYSRWEGSLNTLTSYEGTNAEEGQCARWGGSEQANEGEQGGAQEIHATSTKAMTLAIYFEDWTLLKALFGTLHFIWDHLLCKSKKVRKANPEKNCFLQYDKLYIGKYGWIWSVLNKMTKIIDPMLFKW